MSQGILLVKPSQSKGTCAESDSECNKKDCMYCNLLDKTGSIKKDDRTCDSKTNITFFLFFFGKLSPGVDLTNLCPDVCVKDSETDPF